MADLITLEAITPAVESQLIGRINARMEGVPEVCDIIPGRSKVLRFGWSYDHPEKWVGDIPAWLSEPLWPLVEPVVPDNVTINKYAIGKGIAHHIDSPAFGSPIFILSLNSCATMTFLLSGRKMLKLFVPQRSIITLAGELRTDWAHGIVADRADTDGTGVRHARDKRWSVVLRKKVDASPAQPACARERK